MKVINLIDKNSKDDYFPINISDKEITKYNIIKYYNNIQSIKTDYIKNYEICRNASYKRIVYYSHKFRHNNILKNSLLQLNKDDDEMVTLSSSIDNDNTEFILLSTKKINKCRNILIIEFEKKREISEKGAIFNLFISSLFYYFIPTYKISSFFITFISKGIIDFYISEENVTKMAIFKFLEDNKYINVDIKNKRIKFNI